MACDMCAAVSGEVELPGGQLAASELVVAFHLPPAWEPEPMLGHLLIVPRRHVDTWADMTGEEGAAIGAAATALGTPLRRVTDAERLYSAVVGHRSDHFHLHLFPRYPSTPTEFWFQRVDEWPGSPKGDAQEIAAFVQALRDAAPG